MLIASDTRCGPLSPEMGRVGGAAEAPVAPSVAHGRVWLGAGSMSCLHGGAAFAAPYAKGPRGELGMLHVFV